MKFKKEHIVYCIVMANASLIKESGVNLSDEDIHNAYKDTLKDFEEEEFIKMYDEFEVRLNKPKIIMPETPKIITL